MSEKKTVINVPEDLKPRYSNAFRIGRVIDSGEICIEFGLSDIGKKEVNIFERIILSEKAVFGFVDILKNIIDTIEEEKEEE
jgi:hypothetical protein